MRALLAVALLAACGTDSAPLDGTPPDCGCGDAADGGGTDPAGLAVFDDTRLHVIELVVAPEHLAVLDDDQSDVRVPATITYDGVTVAMAGLRKKGATSLRPLSDKPGFTIKLNHFVAGQKLDGLKKLVLDNAVQDPSLLTGHISYEIYRRAGLPAPRTAHASLRFNGVDKGLYVVEEATNGQYLEAHYGDGTGNLYEGPWDFPHGADRADLKDEVEEQRSRDDLVALTAVVTDAPAGELVAQLAPHLDLDQFIDNWAVEMAAALWDNYAVVAWNYYLYHVPGGRFVILTHGVNWPYWHADMDPFDLHTDPWNAGAPPGFLCDRLEDLPAVATRYRTALTRVSRDAFDVPALLSRLDRFELTLASATLTGPSDADRAAAHAQLPAARTFLRDRKAYLTSLLGL